MENSDLQNGTGPGNSSRFFDGETSNFWPHLQQDGFYKEEYAPFSSDGTSGIRSRINMPVAALGTKTGMVFTVSGTTNQFTLANYDATTTTNHENINPEVVPSLDVAYLYSLDTKIDDGLARSGKITISSWTASCYSAIAPNPYVFSGTVKCIAGITTGN